MSVQAVANYIAKYATKALDAPGIPDRPIRSALDLEALRCHAHYLRMITTAWRLGGGQLTPGPTRLCKWAHMLGYGGHFLTKSRRYSTTFGVLRRARTQNRRQQRQPGGERHPWGRPLDETVVLVLHTWTYAGTGYPLRPAPSSRSPPPPWPARTTGTKLPPDHFTHRGRSDAVMTLAHDRLLTLDQTAEMLNTTPRFSRRLVAERRIRFIRVGRHIRIPESALREFIDAGTVEPLQVRWCAGKVIA